MSSSTFSLICLTHAALAATCGALMMFYLNELQGSTPRDQLVIRTYDSFSGLLLFAVGALLFMVSFVRDADFQTFFAKGCVVLHASTALWRIWVERRVEDLAVDWPRRVVGDMMLGLSWVLFLVSSWRESIFGDSYILVHIEGGSDRTKKKRVGSLRIRDLAEIRNGDNTRTASQPGPNFISYLGNLDPPKA